jgi:hypothetical protein
MSGIHAAMVPGPEGPSAGSSSIPVAEALPARLIHSSEPASRSWQSRWTSWPRRASACARLALYTLLPVPRRR